jgi:hypothetical protein
MKLPILSIALVAGLMLPAAASAQYGYANTQAMDQMTPVPRGFSSDEGRYRRDVKKLHDDAVKLQKADGGQLSDAHKAELQARLDKLNADACAKHVKIAACPATAAAQ